MRKKRLGSYPFLSVVFSTTMALFVLGLFSLLLLFANTLTTLIKENMEIHVYLDNNLTDIEKMNTLKSFYSEDFIAVSHGKKQIFFESKDSSAKQFAEATGEDFVKFLGENPLHDAYIVRIASNYSDKGALKLIKNSLENIDGVFEVVYTESLIDSINSNAQKIGVILLGFAAILLGVVLILIHNSLRLALYSQRFLIRSMQLVGATDFYIKWPFIKNAMFWGSISGLAANVLLGLLLQYVVYSIPEIQQLIDMHKVSILAIIVFFTGPIVGALSCLIAINKYLHMTLDQLY